MSARFDFTPLDHPITEIAGPIVAGPTEVEFQQFGTGVLAAPGLAVTARHVIDDAFRVFGGVALGDAFGKLNIAVEFATLARPSGSMVRWHVKNIHFSKGIDIVALSLEPWAALPPDFSYNLPRFNALPPRAGDIVWAFGFPRSTTTLEAPEILRLLVDPRTTEGTVNEVHHLYRDTSMLHFPCFLTNARFDPGMSGGPVFNESDEICGVICSNLPPSEPDGEHSSYVSLFWPALGLQLTSNNELGAGERVRYLREVAEEGTMKVLNADLVRVERGPTRDRLHLALPPL